MILTLALAQVQVQVQEATLVTLTLHMVELPKDLDRVQTVEMIVFVEFQIQMVLIHPSQVDLLRLAVVVRALVRARTHQRDHHDQVVAREDEL